jgi:hypothetical protein
MPCRRAQRSSIDVTALESVFTVNGYVGCVSDEELVELWRPTGPEEMQLVRDTGSTRWPPRLPEQPIFYPVLNEDYAVRFARDWNVKASGVGSVTRFFVRKTYLDQYDVRQVGGETILEYWIPAEQLDELNENIVGLIEEVAKFD